MNRDDWYEMEIMERVEYARRILRRMGAELVSMSPGVRAARKDGPSFKFDDGAWELASEVVERLEDVEKHLETLRTYLDADDLARVHLLTKALRSAEESEASRQRLLRRVQEVASYGAGKADAGQLLLDIVQWHRASADSAVADAESDAVEAVGALLSTLLRDIKKDEL